ncbi:MAG: hypothetical protein ACKOCM_07765 [Cyanobacteriota bacterium]
MGLLLTPAQAGLLTPLLSLARPQLELSLARQCLVYSAGADSQLQNALARPCEALARPIAACLIHETEASGRALGVISDLISGRFGDASEAVVKRCLAITFGLPGDTFAAVPLRRLAEVHGIQLGSMLARPSLPGAVPAKPVPAGGATVITPTGSTATMQPSKAETP